MGDLPGRPTGPIEARPDLTDVDLAAWQAASEELLVHEKGHTREGDAIAAARRRLPMVELDGAVEVTGVDGPVPFLDLFHGRDELVGRSGSLNGSFGLLDMTPYGRREA